MSYPITFGKYQLLERINVGGMAEVFKAKAFGAEGFERVLAIKRILPNMAEDDEFINMFIDEARIAVQLNHANIVPIYELGKFDNQYYIAMEYVPGKDLRQVFDRFRKKKEVMPQSAAAYVTSKICEGLDYAHRKTDHAGRPLNLIHRDVSPQNILLSYEGSVKITDFGIVKAEDRASKTQAGVLKGKFGYMSPEQVRGLEIDHRSDIFAVGILLYEALTAKRLFIGESDFATLEKVRNAEVVPPSQHNPNVSEALERVVLKALARERDERYQWALELHDDLQQFLIEENSVFNTNKLSILLKHEYRDEIANEMSKMEEFMKMPPPQHSDAMDVAAHMRVAPTADWNDIRSEKTMIFESGTDGAASAQTLIGTSLPETIPPDVPIPDVPPSARESKPGRRLTGIFAAVGLLVVLAGGAAAYLLAMDTNPNEGRLVVNSTPTETVDVFLDDALIGQKTPIVRPNVPIGPHRLLARAPGYSDKRYHFELAAASPAKIDIELTPVVTNSPANVGGDATLEIASEPPLATVRFGGVPQGTTPLSMPVRDTTHPVALEVAKAGFITQAVVVTFPPGERRRTVNVKLVQVGTVDKNAGGPAQTAKLIIRSKPEGATVYLGGAEMGVTPKEIPDLDPHQSYSLELSKEGYRSFEEMVHMSGQTQKVVMANLQAERRHPKVSAAPSVCGGTGAKVSVVAMGQPDCKVTVGRASLGIAPLFEKSSPVGRCAIDVKCPGNKRFTSTRVLKAGTTEKIIIHPEEWQ